MKCPSIARSTCRKFSAYGPYGAFLLPPELIRASGLGKFEQQRRGKPIIKVQCKQQLSTVGQPEVAQLYGHIDSEENGLFVTLGNYSPPARNFERSKPNLRLIDGGTLVDLIFSHYDRFDPSYQTLLPLRQVYVPGSIATE